MEAALQTISVELRKLEAEQLGSISNTTLIPRVSNNIMAVQHDEKKKIFAVIVENTTEILAGENIIFRIKMTHLGLFSYQEINNNDEFLWLICRAAETVYHTAIFQKILELTIAFGIAPLRAFIVSIPVEQIANVHIEKTDLMTSSSSSTEISHSK
ncbi:MAG: hypothetical protein ACRCV3_04685 [Desulfovibrionaceae bacterium]